MDNRKIYQLAVNKVNARIVFYTHAAAYIAVNILLIIVNVKVTPSIMWFQWPLLGWGIGLSLHAIVFFAVYGESGTIERMVEKEMKKGA